MTILRTFQEAYRNLELMPLVDPRDLARFRVEYGQDTLEQLVQLIEDSSAGDSKIIFSGHRGCGKSTLLAELKNSQQLSDRFFVILFSIAQAIENSDVNHISILFAIAVMLMDEADKNLVDLPKKTRQSVDTWFAEHTQTNIRELQGSAEAGVNLLELIKLNLKSNATVRRELKAKFERNVSELVANLNIIAAAIQAETRKSVLVIIDDLDKLDLSVVKPIFKDNIKALCLPGFHIIYTIPMAILRDKDIQPVLATETSERIVRMSVLKLFAKEDSRRVDVKPRIEVLEPLCEMLHRRIPPQLLERGSAETLILYSGGVLREVIRIANECCRICLLQIRREPERIDITVTPEVVKEAINKLRNDFDLRLGKVDYEILQQVYQNLIPDDPAQKEFLDLLHGLHVLEYRNHKTWYDVHPIVVDLLKDRGIL